MNKFVPLISMPGPMELVLILVVVMLVFGAGRLPEIAKSFGEAIREFKKSILGGGDPPTSSGSKVS